MAIIDKWLQAAKRPDCLMAAFPYQGGLWASPCRSGIAWPSDAPRNFSGSNYQDWADYQAFCMGNAPAAPADFVKVQFTKTFSGKSGGGADLFSPLSTTDTRLWRRYIQFRGVLHLFGGRNHTYLRYRAGRRDLAAAGIKLSVRRDCNAPRGSTRGSGFVTAGKIQHSFTPNGVRAHNGMAVSS